MLCLNIEVICIPRYFVLTFVVATNHTASVSIKTSRVCCLIDTIKLVTLAISYDGAGVNGRIYFSFFCHCFSGKRQRRNKVLLFMETADFFPPFLGKLEFQKTTFAVVFQIKTAGKNEFVSAVHTCSIVISGADSGFFLCLGFVPYELQGRNEGFDAGRSSKQPTAANHLIYQAFSHDGPLV